MKSIGLPVFFEIWIVMKSFVDIFFEVIQKTVDKEEYTIHILKLTQRGSFHNDVLDQFSVAIYDAMN